MKSTFLFLALTLGLNAQVIPYFNVSSEVVKNTGLLESFKDGTSKELLASRTYKFKFIDSTSFKKLEISNLVKRAIYNQAANSVFMTGTLSQLNEATEYLQSVDVKQVNIGMDIELSSFKKMYNVALNNTESVSISETGKDSFCLSIIPHVDGGIIRLRVVVAFAGLSANVTEFAMAVEDGKEGIQVVTFPSGTREVLSIRATIVKE